MIRRARMILCPRASGQSAVLVCIFALMLCGGCGNDKSGGPSTPGADIGFQLVNATGVTVSLAVDGPGFSALHTTLGVGGSTPVEVPANVGDLITVTASGPPYTSGNGGCAVSQVMVDDYPNLYGQINILETGVAGDPLIIQCSSGWQ